MFPFQQHKKHVSRGTKTGKNCINQHIFIVFQCFYSIFYIYFIIFAFFVHLKFFGKILPFFNVSRETILRIYQGVAYAFFVSVKLCYNIIWRIKLCVALCKTWTQIINNVKILCFKLNFNIMQLKLMVLTLFLIQFY